MGFFQIEFKPSAEKELRRLPGPILKKVIRSIELLGSNPFPRGVTKLSGTRNAYRLRVGDYRIIYGIDHRLKRLTIVRIRHRKDVYR